MKRHLCTHLMAILAFTGTVSAQSSGQEQEIRTLEAALQAFDAETERIKKEAATKHSYQVNLSFEDHKKQLQRIAEEETACLNDMEATRRRLNFDTLTPEERQFHQDRLNHLINEKYPTFAVQRRALEAGRNTSNKSHEANRKEMEEILRQRAAARVVQVNRIAELRKGLAPQTQAPVANWTTDAGYVTSPFNGELVDVTGLASGSLVKCPYTGKPFRVP